MRLLLSHFSYIITSLTCTSFSRSDEKEIQYSEACNDIVEMKASIAMSFSTIFGLKSKNPWLYVAAITVSLSTLAWLGNQMHNLLLTYFICKHQNPLRDVADVTHYTVL